MISLDALPRHAPPRSTPSRILRTEVRGLDGLLGAQGVQSGQLTEWVGAPSSGKTGLLRTLVHDVRRQGVSVAWVDAGAELMATDWVEDAPGRLWVVRPPRRSEGAFCAEQLLDTASFGLVVIDGAPPLDRSRSIRLQRLARQAGAALVVLGQPRSHSGGVRVHRRFSFSALTESAMDTDTLCALQRALLRRAPLVWRIAGREGRGGQGDERELVLTEAPSTRLVSAPLSPDRPSTRHAGGRGRGRRR